MAVNHKLHNAMRQSLTFYNAMSWFPVMTVGVAPVA